MRKDHAQITRQYEPDFWRAACSCGWMSLAYVRREDAEDKRCEVAEAEADGERRRVTVARAEAQRRFQEQQSCAS